MSLLITTTIVYILILYIIILIIVSSIDRVSYHKHTNVLFSWSKTSELM